MRFSYFILVGTYLVINLSCVIACPADIVYAILNTEQNFKCEVGEEFPTRCITCACVKKDTVVCTKVCDDAPAKATKLCLRPQKLKKVVKKKLSSNNIVEKRYKAVAELAKNCTVGQNIDWEHCKCCNCVCAAPGVARCKPIKGCNDDEVEAVSQEKLADSGEVDASI